MTQGMDPARGLLLVPGLDFANHDDNVSIQFAEGQRGGLSLVCDRSNPRRGGGGGGGGGGEGGGRGKEAGWLKHWI